MTFKFVIWIAVLFLLSSILVYAIHSGGNPYYEAIGWEGDALIKTGNESFDHNDALLNWTYKDGTKCETNNAEGYLSCGFSQEALYVHELIDADKNSINYTILDAYMKVTDGTATGFIFTGYSANFTGGGSWYSNAAVSLRLQNEDDNGAGCVNTPSGSDKNAISLQRWGDTGGETFDWMDGWCADGTEQHIQIVIDGTGNNFAYGFVNGTHVATMTPLENQGSTTKAVPKFALFGIATYGNKVSFNVSHWVSYNGSKYTHSGVAPPPVDPDEQEFIITAQDTYDAESLNNITITISNSSNTFDFTTGNGTIYVSNKTSLESFNVTYDITFNSNQSGGYINHTLQDINITDGGSFEGDIFQSILRINATKIIERSMISDFFVSASLQSNQSNSSDFVTLFLKAGDYNITGNKTGFLNSTSNISINALDDLFLTLEFATHRLRIDARDKFSNESISSFNVTITGLNITHSETKGTTTGNVSFDIETGSFTVDIFGNNNYALDSANVSVDNVFTNHTFLSFPRNSILITVYEEGTSTQIGDADNVADNRTTTADFDSTLQVLNLSSVNGTMLAEGIQPTDYTITIGSAGFDSRQYLITLNPNSHVGLSAYLSNSTDTTSITFTVNDISNQKELPDIRISISDKINLTYVTIDQKDTDIAGQAKFDLDQTKTYRFTMSGGGYETRTFDLKPITTAYTIELTPTAKIDFTTIFNSIDFTTLPVSSIITNTSDLINFSIITTSLTGITIEHFGLNTTYLGTLSLTNVSGSAGGGTASIFLNLGNMTGSVGVTYFIDIDGEIPFVLDRTFYVSNVTATNQSMEVSLKDFSERVGQPIGAIIGTIFVILIMATFASMGLRDRRMNVVGAIGIGFLAMYGFFNIFIAGVVIVGLMLPYFIGYLRSEDE